MVFCLCLVCCIVTIAHSAGRLVCTLSLIIASGKTTFFVCKTKFIADCMCCDKRQTARRTQTPSPLTQTLAFPVTAEPAEQLPNLTGHNFEWKSHSHWDLWRYGRFSSDTVACLCTFASVNWNWCTFFFFNGLYSPSVNGKKLFTQMDRSYR